MSLLQVKQVRKNAGSNVLIPYVDFEVKQGQCVAIQCNHELGSQLLESIMGRISISDGEIFLDGIQVNMASQEIVRKSVGVQRLNEGVYERLKVAEFLRFYAMLHEVKADLYTLLRRLGLSEKENTLISKLSLSEKRRLLIAKALVHEPKLLLLEDPEQNVDLETSYILRNLIASLVEEGKSVLITTMVLEQAISVTSEVYLYSHSGLKKLDTSSEVPETEAPEDGLNVTTIADGDTDRTDGLPTDQANRELSVDNSEEDINTLPYITENEVMTKESDTAQIKNKTARDEDKSEVFVQPVRLEKIPAKVGDKLILFDPTEVDYIESQEGVANLHVLQGTYPCSFSLTVLEEKLKPYGFFRCHRSYLVNLQKVREVITWTRNSYSLILEDTEKSSIPLSKGKYDELKQILGI
ncbi:LytTR family transcriptional regulator DNA-binding domain-containing protein [Paenibacillus gallinarum]|uniref:LytTR family transcriptional regulator DNA-binding domain-containing protein n=1 Tax=Paenibacillus gallinarum TaxID=2762232 RepID=A0ABR8T4Z1_9BACL|nr:LytTR family transcriptional regulator DNA-binding domain-containing protein [Paenibacillus gallinarum]MBD7970838.1 LytTR family transcriptional regulator DNA-binding domain-containing protein [Paenibacillus gallinarum]